MMSSTTMKARSSDSQVTNTKWKERDGASGYLSSMATGCPALVLRIILSTIYDGHQSNMAIIWKGAMSETKACNFIVCVGDYELMIYRLPLMMSC